MNLEVEVQSGLLQDLHKLKHYFGDLSRDQLLSQFGTHPSQSVAKKLRSDLEENLIKPTDFLREFVAQADPKKPIQFCTFLELSKKAVACLASKKTFSETRYEVLVETTYALLVFLEKSFEVLLSLAEPEFTGEEKGYITRAIVSSVNVTKNVLLTTNLFMLLVVDKMKEKSRWDVLLSSFQGLYNMVMSSNKVEIQLSLRELWGHIRFVEGAPSTSLINLSPCPEFMPPFWLKKLRMTEGNTVTLFLRFFLEKQIYSNEVISTQQMEYILELFMLQRAYRVSEFLLLIWISSFQFCLQKHLSPIDLKIAYSFIFSKMPKIMATLVKRNFAKKRFGEQNSLANEIEISLLGVSKFTELYSAKTIHSGLNLLQVAILSCLGELLETANESTPMARLSVLSNLSPALKKECDPLCPLLDPNFKNDRFLTISVIDNMSESITNSPPQVIEHLILSVISGLGEQLHVESHLSRYVLELLKPSLFIPLEASMFTANQLTLSRAALVIVANHVGVPKLLQTLISRCTDLDADKDLDRMEFSVFFNLIYSVVEIFQLRTNENNKHILEDLKNLQDYGAPKPDVSLDGKTEDEGIKIKDRDGWFWKWMNREVLPGIGQIVINRIFISNQQDVGKDMENIDLLIALPFFLKQCVAYCILDKATPIIPFINSLLSIFPFLTHDLFYYFLQEANASLSTDSQMYFSILEDLLPTLLLILKNAETTKRVSRLVCGKTLRILCTPSPPPTKATNWAEMIQLFKFGVPEPLSHTYIPIDTVKTASPITFVIPGKILPEMSQGAGNSYLRVLQNAFLNPLQINRFHIYECYAFFGTAQTVKIILTYFLSANNEKLNAPVISTELISACQVASYLISIGGKEALILLCNSGLEFLVPVVTTPLLGHAIADLICSTFSFLGIGRHQVEELDTNTKQRLVSAIENLFKCLAAIFDHAIFTSVNLESAALPITVPLPLTAISLFGSTKDGIMHVYGDSKRFAQLITYLHQKTEETVESSSTRTGRRMLGIFILIMNSLLVKCFDVRTSEGQHSCISFLTEDTNV